MFEKLLKKIAHILDAAAVPYMLIGGQAVLLYGEPRLTKDIDITLGVGIEGLEKLRTIATQLGFSILVEDVENFVQRTMVLPAVDTSSGIRIDFIFSFSPYERGAIARSKKVDINGVVVHFAALEDVIIHKMIAGRPRDIEDIRSMLLKNPTYDLSYIETWLAQFDDSFDEHYVSEFQKIRDAL